MTYEVDKLYLSGIVMMSYSLFVVTLFVWEDIFFFVGKLCFAANPVGAACMNLSWQGHMRFHVILLKLAEGGVA